MAAHLKLKHDQAPPDPDNSTKIQPTTRKKNETEPWFFNVEICDQTRKEILAKCAAKDGFPINVIRKSEVSFCLKIWKLC